MRVTKWIFFGYIAFVLLICGAISLSTAMAPLRDPQTLYLVYNANIKAMDPAQINDEIANIMVGNIFECLYNYKYKVRPYELLPALAAEMPQISPDGKTVTIRLRKGIHFYEPEKKLFPNGVGPEVKASDLIYSWKRIADFHLASNNYSQFIQGRIEGIDEWWDYTQKTEEARIDWERPISGLTALDDYTLRIKLTRPYPQLTYVLAHISTAAVCRKVVETYGRQQVGKHPVGTGPYALEEHQPEQRIIFRINPIYRGRPDVDGDAKLSPEERLPKIQRIQYDYFEEVVPAWLLFQQGLFDQDAIPKESFHQAISVQSGDLTPAMEKKGIRLYKSPDPVTYFVGINMKDPVLGKNKALRQAMSMAFNREEFIRVFLNGRGVVARGPIPPDLPTYNPNFKSPYTIFNLKAAREKMEEARRIHGGPIPPLAILEGDTSTSTRQMVEFFQTQMAQIGLTIKPEYMTWSRYQEMVDQHQGQLFDQGWGADYPDERTFFDCFYSKFGEPGGANTTAYANAEFDKLYEQAIVMPDTPQRQELYQKMQQIVIEDCPWLLKYHYVRYALCYDWLKDYDYMPYGNGMRAYQTLDVDARRRRWFAKH